MPPISGIKTSWAGGEFAPSLYSRVDLAKYSTGARKLRNFLVHPHGGISNRPGFKYIATEKTANKKVRLIPFEFSTTQTYVLEFGDYYCRFYTDGAQINDDTSYDNYTKFLSHFNASPFTDEIGNAITNNSGAIISQTTAPTDTSLGDSGGVEYRYAQSFQRTADFTCSGIKVKFGATTGSPSGQVTCTVETDSGGAPSGALAHANATLTFTPTASAVNTITFPGSFILSANTTYWLRLNCSNQASGVYWTILIDDVSSYADGTLKQQLDGGSWSDMTRDMYFEVLNPVEADTSIKKFGAASAKFNGANYFSLADSDNWYSGSGDFTFDAWVYFTSLSGKQGLVGQYEDANNYWVIGKNADNTLFIIFKDNSTTMGYYTTTAAPSLSTGAWYHLEFARSGSNAYIFVDGISQNLTATTNFGFSDVGNIAGTLNIGYDVLNNAFFSGNIDEPRFSKGVARHTANFTAPVSAYSPGTVYEISTPYAEADLSELNYTQSADILYLTHPNYAPRQLERSGNTDWDLNLYDYTNGPFQIANTNNALTLAISNVAIGTGRTLTAVGFTFNSLHVGSLWKLRHYIEGQAVTAALASVTTTSSINCGGTWRLITHGTWTATIRIEKSTDGGSTWTMLREFSSADDFNANTFGTEDMSDGAEPFKVRINMTARTSGTCNVNLTSDPYFQDGICKITAVAVGGATATADVKRTFGATTATADWNEGSWSDYRGWPAVVEFHPEDRLMFANCTNEPQTYWMTQTANYINFWRNDPLVDSDAISSPLPSRKVNGVNGLVPLSEMIALTLSSEVSIRSSSGPLTPTSAFNKIHGWEGSYGIKPVVIGNRAVYVQSTGSVVRDLGFDLYEDSFKGSDLTIFSNHLFSGYTITEIAYQQNPDRIVWCVRSDGKLLAMTYMREQEVVAWGWHDTNDGTDLFESACVIRGSGYDEVWVSVNRGGTRYIERMAQRMASSAPEDQFFVDCGTTYDSTPTVSVTGLTHLASKAVSVLADGVVVSGKTVSAGGVLTLDTAASVVQVGLAYKSDMETLDIEVDLADGTAQGRKTKPSRLVLRLLSARGLSLGPDDSTLYAQGIGSASVLFSGDHPATVGGGYRSGGRIFLRQSDPLPVSITALIPEIAIGGMTQN